jgi:hypothetical protein
MESDNGEVQANPVFVSNKVNKIVKFFIKKTKCRNGKSAVRICFLEDLFAACETRVELNHVCP